MVKHFLKLGLDINIIDSQGRTLLMAAASSGHISIAEWLIQQNVAVNAIDNNGESALHYAVREDHADVTELLLANGADVHLQSKQQLPTPLALAVATGHTECTKVLIAGGADVTYSDDDGMTYLHRAAANKHKDMVQLLLSGGAVTVINALGVETDDADCMTALMMCEDVGIAKLLLDAGADVHETTGTGDTCLHVAAAHKHPAAMICLLIKAGVDIHAVNDDGQTAAQVAHDYGNDLIEQLLNRAAQQS
jgi:uncharacterized protein